MIADLSVHPHFRRALVDAFFAEWPEWCHRVGRAAREREGERLARYRLSV